MRASRLNSEQSVAEVIAGLFCGAASDVSFSVEVLHLFADLSLTASAWFSLAGIATADDSGIVA